MKPKYFLLIAGQDCYPSIGDGDWIVTLETLEEAQEEVSATTRSYWVRNVRYDWFDIIDLRNWVSPGPRRKKIE